MRCLFVRSNKNSSNLWPFSTNSKVKIGLYSFIDKVQGIVWSIILSSLFMKACCHPRKHRKQISFLLTYSLSSYEPPRDKTNKISVRPAKTQISLGIHPVWPESSLCALRIAKDPRFLHAKSEDSDQTGWMPKLIWVIAGRTGYFVGFVTRRLNYCLSY